MCILLESVEESSAGVSLWRAEWRWKRIGGRVRGNISAVEGRMGDEMIERQVSGKRNAGGKCVGGRKNQKQYRSYIGDRQRDMTDASYITPPSQPQCLPCDLARLPSHPIPSASPNPTPDFFFFTTFSISSFLTFQLLQESSIFPPNQ